MTNIEHRRKSYRPRPRWQQQLQHFFQLPMVDLLIGGLIVASVGLTMIELSLEESSPYLAALDRINHTITWTFVMELTGRFFAASSKRRFFREYWIDILAILPLFRPFRIARALRLLRLLRMLRLLGLLNRYASYFPYIVRRGALEYIMVCGLILLTIIFGSEAILVFEQHKNPELKSFEQVFWFSIYSLFAGEPIPEPPYSLGGRLVTVFIMFMGLTIFAMFTGTVSAFMIERLRTEKHVVEWDEFNNHIIICGWNRKAEIIVREYQTAYKGNDLPIVVVAELDGEPTFLDPDLRPRVRFLNEDFTRVSALEKAGIHRASTCIILSDTSQDRSEQDADARTILAALTAEKLNPNLYTCAELNHREYGSHLEMGHVNDYVISGEHSGFLLAQAALNRGLMSVFTELLTYERGNQFYRIPVPFKWVGKSFFDLFVYLKQSHNTILVAVYDTENKLHINPTDHTFKDGEHLIIIAEHKIQV